MSVLKLIFSGTILLATAIFTSSCVSANDKQYSVIAPDGYVFPEVTASPVISDGTEYDLDGNGVKERFQATSKSTKQKPVFDVFTVSQKSGKEIFIGRLDGKITAVHKKAKGYPMISTFRLDKGNSSARTLYAFDGVEYVPIRSESTFYNPSATSGGRTVKIDLGAKKYDPYDITNALSMAEINLRTALEGLIDQNKLIVKQKTGKRYSEHELEISYPDEFTLQIFLFNSFIKSSDKLFELERPSTENAPGIRLKATIVFSGKANPAIAEKINSLLQDGGLLEFDIPPLPGSRITMGSIPVSFDKSASERIKEYRNLRSYDYMSPLTLAELYSNELELLIEANDRDALKNLKREALDAVRHNPEAYSFLSMKFLTRETQKAFVLDTDNLHSDRVGFLNRLYITGTKEYIKQELKTISRTLLSEQAFSPHERFKIIMCYARACEEKEDELPELIPLLEHELKLNPPEELKEKYQRLIDGILE